jgi:hypothetical protein
VVNIEDVDKVLALVDPVENAVSTAQGAVTASERPKKRLADPVRVDRQRGIANSSTAAATASGSRWAIAGLAADWKRISYRCAGSVVTRR